MEISRQYLLLRADILQKNSRWVPLVIARCEIYTGGFVCEVRVLGFVSPVEVPVLVCLPTSLVFHWFVAFILSDRS